MWDDEKLEVDGVMFLKFLKIARVQLEAGGVGGCLPCARHCAGISTNVYLLSPYSISLRHIC